MALFDEDANELPDIIAPEAVGAGLGLAGTEAFEGLAAESANQNAALGLAQPLVGPSVSSRTQSDKDYLDSLPTAAKIGLAMQSFAAGYEGKQNPIDTLLANRRAEEKAAREQLASIITTIDKGMGVLRRLPAGSIQRKAVAQELGKLVGPQFAPLFEAAGSEHEDAVRSMVSVVRDSDVQNQIIEYCRGDADQRACFSRAITNDGLAKTMYKTVDAKRLPDIQRKMRIVSERLKAEGKTSYTLADLAELNQGETLFSRDEMGTIERNEAFFDNLGLKTTEAVREGQKSAARIAERPEREPVVGSLRSKDRPEGGTVQEEYVGNGLWRVVGGKPPPHKEASAAEKAKLAKEKAAYDNAITQLQKYKIGPDGQSSEPKTQKRLLPKAPLSEGSSFVTDNPNYDPQFAGRVRAWLKLTEAGDPAEREAVTSRPSGAVQPAAGAPAAAPKSKTEPGPRLADPRALTEQQRAQILAKVNEAIRKGADPQKVKAWAKRTYGLELEIK